MRIVLRVPMTSRASLKPAVASSVPSGSLDSVGMQAAKRPAKLLDQVRSAIRTRHYSVRTENTYVAWIRRFIVFHGKRHPAEMGEAEIHDFLTFLATENKVSASTQNQALAALLFLYRNVMGRNIRLDRTCRSSETSGTAAHGVDAWRDTHSAQHDERDGMARRLAAVRGGLRLTEALRLRIKDVDFTRNEILVRDGKGRIRPLCIMCLEGLCALDSDRIYGDKPLGMMVRHITICL